VAAVDHLNKRRSDRATVGHLLAGTIAAAFSPPATGTLRVAHEALIDGP
jgi:hypothetical protein